MSLQFGSNIFYYNKNIKNLLIGFLNVFSQFQIQRVTTGTSGVEQIITVPILFGPIERSPYMNSEGQTVNRIVELPLLHFELTGLEIDKDRAFPMKTLHILGTRDGIDIDNLMPFPYRYQITLNIYTRYEEDTMQLLEQIVPLFNYHRVFYIKHPVFPEEITLSNWVSISSSPSFAFNHEYAANERRGVLAVPLTFTIEGWMVREAYITYGLVKEIITNYYDYITQAGLERFKLIGDPTIRQVVFTPSGLFTPSVGQLIQGSNNSATIVDILSSSAIIVKFNTELQTFLTGATLMVGTSPVGTLLSCEPYAPFKTGSSSWSGYLGYSGYSEIITTL